MPNADAFDLQRFVSAQNGVYEQVLRELRAGRKRSHWMWFVFPQITGLGFSATSQHFAISGLAEASAYLAHPLLGSRLLQCVAVLRDLETDDAVAVFGSVDAQKLRSSMTLFAHAADDGKAFQSIVDKFFDGIEDEATLTRLH